MNQVVKLNDHKKIEDLIRERVGKKFIFTFINDDGDVLTYMSEDLNHMEKVYMGENIKDIAFERSNNE